MMKKILLGVLACCFVFCMAAFAEGVEINFAGEGTEDNPYLIGTVEELYQFAAVMNDEKLHYDYQYGCFQLTADIELNDCAGFEAWDENPPANVWTPIGYYWGFDGVFDGNGHTVSGLYINQASAKDTNDRMMEDFGFFGKNSGEIRNLNIKNAFIHPVKGETSLDAGILAGSNSGSISGCAVEGVVICVGYDHGGVAGGNYGVIADCSFAGKLIEREGSSGAAIGGIAGSGGTIRNCSVSAQIICEKTDDSMLCAGMGGIAGYAGAFTADEYIENCTFEGEIHSGNYAGGIVGHAGAGSLNDDDTKTIIRNCTNYGSVTAFEDAGGIVGFAMNTDSTG